MATTTPTIFYRGAFATSSGNLGTAVPASTQWIITNIVLTNTHATVAATATVSLAGTVLIPAVNIPASSFVAFDLKQPLAAAAQITGFASATTVNAHISGVAIGP